MLKIVLMIFVFINYAESENLNEQVPSQIKEPAAPAKKSLKVGEIKPEQTDEIKNRRESLRLTGVGFGPYFGNNLNTDDLFYAFSLGKHFDVHEYGEIFLDSDIAIEKNSNALGLDIGIGGAILLPQDISPVVGAELGFCYMNAKKINYVLGFCGSGILGVRFFRTSNVHLSVEGKYTLSFNSNQLGSPSIYGLQVKLLF